MADHKKKRERGSDVVMQKGLPASLEAEQFVLGHLINAPKGALAEVRCILDQADFSLQKNRIIFEHMCKLAEAGSDIDRVTLANSIMSAGQLDAIDGISYLSMLDADMPQLYNPESYCRIVKEKSSLRRLIWIANELTLKAMSQEEPATSVIQHAQDALSDLCRVAGVAPGQSIQEYVDNYPGGYEAIADVSKRRHGIPFGFERLDDLSGGLSPEMIMILAARPGVGKTAFGLCLAENLSEASGAWTVYFSMEVSTEPLIDRMVTKSSGVDNQRLRKGLLTSDERALVRQAIADLYDRRIIFDDTPGLTVGEAASRVAMYKRKYGHISGAIFDYVQLMKPAPDQRANNRNDAMTFIANDLQFWAKREKVGSIILSQLRRPDPRFANKRPTMEELRESGTLEQVGWLIALLHQYKDTDREDRKGILEMIIDKNRQGPRGIFALRFDGATNTFRDAPDVQVSE